MVVYTVMCTILGHNKPFSVKIDINEPVSELKKQIRGEELRTLESFGASALQLFKINAHGDTSKERINALEEELQRISSDAPLDALDCISDVFPEMPPVKTYHILVVPPQGEHSTNGHGRW